MPKKTLITTVLTLIITSTLAAACQTAGANSSVSLTETTIPSASMPATAAPEAAIPQTAESQVQAAGPALATPYAESPAAGICAEAPGEELVSVEIFPDIPSPRCIKVTAGQKLEVLNRTDAAVHLSLGSLEHDLPPGEAFSFSKTFGELLMPGVHVLGASPFSGPELWLQD